MRTFMDEVNGLTEDEFLRLARVLYEYGTQRLCGDVKDPALKWKLKARIEEWLEIE